MGAPLSTQPVERSAIRKVAMRLVPFVAVMFFINYLDRTAISFAGPNGMNQDLGLTAAQFGFASGIFFAGYILLEIPSNMALYKFGARRWLARIMVSWGIVSLLFAFVQNIPSLYALRILLGIAEAGFFPGAILFLSLWVPARYRSKILALFYLAQPLTTVIGAPLAGWLIGHDGVFGLEGWRFMFLCVSVPAILIGIIAWFYLADSPKQAKWLTAEEAEWLSRETEGEAKKKPDHGGRGDFMAALRSGRVWVLAVIYFGFIYGLYALAFFLPTIISGFQEQFGTKFDVFEKGLITAIPYLPAAVVLYLWSRDATKRGLRTWHIAGTGLRRRRERADRAVHGFADGHHRGDHRDGVRHLRRTAQLLDRACPVPHRGVRRRGNRVDQHPWQRGRLRRGVRHRRHQGSDRVLCRTDVRRRRPHGALRPVDGLAQPQGADSDHRHRFD